MTTCRIVSYRGDRWDVTLDGAAIVTGSRDPEFDACRALLDRGVTGPVSFLDAKTGRARSTIADIAAGAGWRTAEEDARGLRRKRFEAALEIAARMAALRGPGAPRIAPTDCPATHAATDCEAAP
jgi:hypothetical protein